MKGWLSFCQEIDLYDKYSIDKTNHLIEYIKNLNKQDKRTKHKILEINATLAQSNKWINVENKDNLGIGSWASGAGQAGTISNEEGLLGRLFILV